MSTYGGSANDVSDFTELLKTINKVVEGENVRRIALDPVTSLMLRYVEELKKRRATVAFFDALADSGCTSLITSELKTSLMDRRFQLEEFLSHGVVLLHTLFHEGNMVRAVQIEKMRGISHDTQIRPYQFGITGIEVFPRDKVFWQILLSRFLRVEDYSFTIFDPEQSPAFLMFPCSELCYPATTLPTS